MARKGKTRIELIGGDELRKKIHNLGDAVQGINRTAAQAAQKPIMDEANSLAPGPNIIALTSKKESTEDRSVVNIGPDKEHWYYQFIETGVSAHEMSGKSSPVLAFMGRGGVVITKLVRHPGFAARPFLRPAMNHNRDQAQKVSGQVFLQEINRISQ